MVHLATGKYQQYKVYLISRMDMISAAVTMVTDNFMGNSIQILTAQEGNGGKLLSLR